MLTVGKEKGIENKMNLLLIIFLLTPIQELTRYIHDCFEPINKTRDYEQRRSYAESLIPIVIEQSDRYGIDHLLVAQQIELESNWQITAIGARKERGLMQVMPRLVKDRFDLKTAQGQIEAGVFILRNAIGACRGDLLQGINRYKSGKCKPILKRSRWIYRNYKKMIRKYRGKK